MRLSNAGINLLKSIEELRLLPYDDQTGARAYHWEPGVTIGYGHLLDRDEWHCVACGISEDHAEALFRHDLIPFEKAIDTAVEIELKQYQFDALVILAFNIGAHSAATSSAVKLINDPDAATSYPSLEEAWKAWDKSQGKVNRGLVNRRAAEWTLYTTGAYTRW